MPSLAKAESCTIPSNDLTLIIACHWAQRPKLGFVATEPGSRLRFTIDTRHSAASSVAEPATVVAVSFLRSYETMGMASASQSPVLLWNRLRVRAGRKYQGLIKSYGEY